MDQIELPQDGRLYKIVQLYVDGTPRLETGSASADTHASILERTLKELGVSYGTIRSLEHEIPALGGKDKPYEVVGMGYLKRELRGIVIYGRSEEYKIGVNKEHIDRCKPLIQEIEEDVQIFVE